MCCCTYLVDIFKSRIAALYPTAVLKSLHRLPAPVPAVGKVLLNVLFVCLRYSSPWTR